MEKSGKISALAITLNEAGTMRSFLESLWFADEIIIVDSLSSDETRAIASENEKVTFYERKFDNFSAQKNFALSKAKHDWVVFFDLDEEVTKPLSEEIVKELHDPTAVAYEVKRDFYFMGKRIKYSGLQNDRVVRFL